MDRSHLCTHCNQEIGSESLAAFVALLPSDSDYVICSASNSGGELMGTVRLKCSTVEGVKSWMKEFQTKSLMTFRILSKKPVMGQKSIYSVYFRCMHNTRTKSDKVSSKNTDCPAKLKIRVQKTEFQRKNHTSNTFSARLSQSRDPHMPVYPTTIHFQLNHNHPIETADVLRSRDVGDEAKAKILALLRDHHNPSSALRAFKADLQKEHPDRYTLLSSDRFYCPDLHWCYRLYYKHFGQKYESSSNSADIEDDETADNEILCPHLIGAEETVGDDNPKVLCPLLIERYMSFQSKIIEMAKNDPVAFGPALEAYLRQGEAMSAPSLLSAMHCFGLNTGVKEELFVTSDSS